MEDKDFITKLEEIIGHFPRQTEAVMQLIQQDRKEREHIGSGHKMLDERREVEIVKREIYARANEHHVISGLMTNRELRELSTATMSAMKRRLAELEQSLKQSTDDGGV